MVSIPFFIFFFNLDCISSFNHRESIDAILNPVISRATVKKGRRLFIKLGDSEVEFHPNFKLFLHTKLSNPHYPPEIQAEAALVNFSVTEDGLEDQLLAMVVEQERPDLATQRLDLISQQNGFLIKMQQLEDGAIASPLSLFWLVFARPCY